MQPFPAGQVNWDRFHCCSAFCLFLWLTCPVLAAIAVVTIPTSGCSRVLSAVCALAVRGLWALLSGGAHCRWGEPAVSSLGVKYYVSRTVLEEKLGKATNRKGFYVNKPHLSHYFQSLL